MEKVVHDFKDKNMQRKGKCPQKEKLIFEAKVF
jgi:hypothetical protein